MEAKGPNMKKFIQNQHMPKDHKRKETEQIESFERSKSFFFSVRTWDPGFKFTNCGGYFTKKQILIQSYWLKCGMYSLKHRRASC